MAVMVPAVFKKFLRVNPELPIAGNLLVIAHNSSSIFPDKEHPTLTVKHS
jgi:hypothetical protein